MFSCLYIERETLGYQAMVILYDAVRKLWLVLFFQLLNTGLLFLKRLTCIDLSEKIKLLLYLLKLLFTNSKITIYQ
jgi:hypothetical protein